MKKYHNLFGATIIVLSMVLYGAAPAAAAEKDVLPCTETSAGLIDPGTWTFPDGNIHIRGMVELLDESSPDPRDIGQNTIVLNANWNSEFTGPMWGTFSLVTEEGGLWEGTWAGLMTQQGPQYNATGDGFGLYAGMKIWVDMDYGVCQVTFLEH